MYTLIDLIAFIKSHTEAIIYLGFQKYALTVKLIEISLSKYNMHCYFIICLETVLREK